MADARSGERLRGGHLYLDCFSGAAGDMVLGALFDLGVPEEVVREALGLLPVGGYELQVGRAVRNGMAACDVTVKIKHEHGHEHEHRTFAMIRSYLTGLPDGVRGRAEGIFLRIATAEAKVHGIAVDSVTFHEVGAIDSIVDVVGTAAALDWLAPMRITARPVPLGHGTTRMAHGSWPAPSPAALEILRGLPVEDGGAAMELCTPTGAAILAASCADFGPPPAGRLLAIGYGAGDRDPPDRPNVLRAMLYAPESAAETVVVLEANLDDMNPELCEPLSDALFAAGARDAWFTPIVMKKGRPALTVSALCDEAAREAVTAALLRESTTIGVRWRNETRRMLARRIETVKTPYGAVQVKVASDGATDLNAAPEYASCREAARAAGVPVKDVYAAALAAWRVDAS